MALQDQVIPVHFGQGIQSKTDPKLVPVGPVLQLQDAVFTEQGAVNKRNGYEKLTKTILGGTTLSATPQMVAELNGELVCADNGQLYAYSDALGVWLNRGPYAPFKVSVGSTARSTPGYANIAVGSALFLNAAYVGDIGLLAYKVATAPRRVIASIVNTTNNEVLLDAQNITVATNPIPPVPLALGGTVLSIFVKDTSNHPALAIAMVSASTIAIAASVAINSDTMINTTTGASAQATATGGVVAYATSTTNLRLVTVNTAGVAVNTANITTVGTTADTSTQLWVDPITGSIWVYFVDGVIIKYAIFNSSLTPVLASTTLFNTAEAILGPITLSVKSTSATTQTVYYSYSPSSFTVAATHFPESNTVVNTCTITSGGVVGANTTVLKEIYIMSEIFTLGGVDYFIGGYGSTTQQAYFIYRRSDLALCACLLSGQAQTNQAFSYGTISTRVKALSSGKIFIPLLQGVEGLTSSALTLRPACVTLDSDNVDLYQNVTANNNLVMNGGQLYAYDNATITDLGFHVAPQIFYTEDGASSLAAGTYIHYVTYQWVDNNGNQYESAPSVASSYVDTVGSSIKIYFTWPFITNKINVQVKIWRTLSGGTVPYLVSIRGADLTTFYGSYDDSISDTVIAANPTLYTTGGILENNAPPPATAMLVKNNRLWVVSDETKNEVWYSKTFFTTGGINFSGFLLEDVAISSLQITALAGMDEKIIYFNPEGMYYTVGDGGNDSGGGSTLSLPQEIPADTGCSQSSGVITFPTGVMVKTPKGIYQLDRALNFQYFGAPMERYNNQTITATSILYSKSQIRFLCSDGLTMTYDYIFNQWSTFTNHIGVSATIWNGDYVYVRTDGELYIETEGYYLDDTTAFGVLIQTANLSFADVQGFERVKQFLILGDYTNGSNSLHGIQTSMAYDFESTFTTTNPFYFADTTPYQYRTFLPRQKCDTVSILIQELVTGDSAEYVTFTDMSVLTGVKKGLNKVKAAASVG